MGFFVNELDDPSPREEAVNAIAGSIARETDSLLSEAITRELGVHGWTLEDLRGQLTATRYPDGVEVFALGGAAILELHPIEIEHEHDLLRTMITAKRKYRFLKQQEKKDEGLPATSG